MDEAAPDSTRVLLLGTGAGPTPKPGRNPTAAALLHGKSSYIVDCGNGVGLQLARAGIPFSSLRALLITHHHLDHVADFGTLVAQAWTQLEAPVAMIGPPPLKRMSVLYQELYAIDLASRVAEEHRRPLAELMDVREITGSGVCFADGSVRIRHTPVRHGSIEHAFAYRFDCTDRSVVFSGDTAYSPELAEFARGAHTLVHEAVFLPALNGAAIGGKHSSRTLDRIVRVHSSVEQAARVAHQANVVRLVLSPLTPAGGVSDAEWAEVAARHFGGEIVVGRDLLET
ncbi:MAG TPA: MBL fold metallo-hydrolase [Steroidobacteraceae bacterium]|nr:MBL fold metallo-hydrolase [Steroidobacteraceae bacterium]